MYKPSVFSFHSNAYSLIFRNFFHNYFNYFGFALFASVAVFNPILLPIVMLFTTAYFVSFSDKGIANIRASLKNVDMDVNRYLNLFIISGLKNAIIISGYILFIIPGIILSFGLANVNYNIVKKPESKASEVLESSWNSMNGYKGDYFGFTVVAYLPLFIWGLIIFLLNVFAFRVPTDTAYILVIGFNALFTIAGVLLLPVWFAELQLSKALFFKYVSSDKPALSNPTTNNYSDEPGLKNNNNSAKLPF